MTYWLELENARDVAYAAADTIEEHARQAIQQRGEFRLVLAGGSTPLECYRRLAQRSLDWTKWKIFYGDERCLPVEDPERNHQLVAVTGLTEMIDQHFIIPAELGAESGAIKYQALIADQMPFDMVLLGMGEDGHTASLFPGLGWDRVDPEQMVIAVSGAPKPPPERISLSKSALQNCRHMLVLITGDSKREALQRWKQGESLPVAEVSAIDQATVIVEAGLLP